MIELAQAPLEVTVALNESGYGDFAALKPSAVPVGYAVSDTKSFLAALESAKGGETIMVRAGVVIGPLKVSKKVFAKPVRIIGRGQIVNMDLVDCQGLVFDGLEFYAKSPGHTLFNITRSKRLVFQNLNIHGSLDGNPKNDGAAFSITRSSEITIRGNEFQQLKRAVIANNTDRLTIERNDIHDMQTDGMIFAEMTNLRIVGNFIGQFSPVTGDHPDGIQVLTRGTTVPTRGVYIADNLIYRGDGAGMQGIFFGNEDDVPFEDIEITRNLLIGTGYRGISVGGGRNITITDNELWGQTQMVKGEMKGIANGIHAPRVDGLVVVGNRSSGAVGLAENAAGKNGSVNVTKRGNTLTSKSATSKEVDAAISSWKARGGFTPARLAR